LRFVDEVRIHVSSGKGGDGAITFRREKYVPFGGPDGGDGGRGGNVVIVGDEGRSSLLELRGKAIWKAQAGIAGSGRQKTGAVGTDCCIRVPVGTQVFDEATGELIADLVAHEQRAVVAAGGSAGKGNVHFKSSRNQAPRKNIPGGPSVERRLRLELKLMADVGLLGFPNAGKSTMVSALSAARPKVADYPFTTLVPSLGVVDMGMDGSFVVADIPGLIRGAAEGAGLGHRFLRHLGRTRQLLHLVSMGPDEVDPPEVRYQAIRDELVAFDRELSERPELVVLTKADVADIDAVRAAGRWFAERVGREHVLLASAVSGAGLDRLKHTLWTRVKRAKAAE